MKLIMKRMGRRISDPLPRRSPTKDRPRRLSDVAGAPVAKVAAVRQHTSLPLLHDFTNLYGIKSNDEFEYTPGVYPWKNSKHSAKTVQKLLNQKQLVNLGRLPVFKEVSPQHEVSMDENKRNFFIYMAVPEPKVKLANQRQLGKDVDGTRHKWMDSHIPNILKRLFVHDDKWTGRYPLYIQGMDRMVNSWRISHSVHATIHSLRLVLLAIEYVYAEEVNCIHFLGKLSPWETTDVAAHQILPLFDVLNSIVDGNMQPHEAYHLAEQLRAFYETHKLSKVKHFMSKPNTLRMLHTFLQKYDMISPMVVDNPDLLIAFRGLKTRRSGSAQLK